MAKYVKLSVQSAHGITGQSGLAEVRFTAIPVFPRAPHPADGTSATGVDVQMRWRSGREAVSHDVAFGPDPDAVAQGTAPVNTVSDSRYDAGILDFGTQYFWQVAEVNDAATPSVHAGDIWSFTTPEYDIFEDIESYSGEEGQEIYMTWWDGYGGDDVLGGSTTGYIDAPFVETSIVNPGMGGSQSMPMFFDNSGGFINIDGITSAPTYSEVLRELDGLDFTTGNAQVLALSFRGHAVGFAEDTDGSISMSAAGSDIWGTADQFRFAYITLTGDGAITAKVRSLTTVHDWSKAGIMIRETLAPDSSFATMVATGINGVTFQQRLLAGGSATSDSNTRDTAQADQDDEPVWLRLERTGTNFNAYWSLDGVTWNPSVANPQTIPMNSPTIYIGLGVTSHSPGNPATAVFSDLSFTGNVTGAWTAEVIGDEAMPSNDGRDPLYITVEDSTGKSVTVIHPDPTAIQTGTWQDWLIPMTEFDSLRKSGVKAIGIGVGYRDGSQTGTEGILYIDDIRLGTPITTE